MCLRHHSTRRYAFRKPFSTITPGERLNETSLAEALSHGNKALLRYSASSGQVILLLRSNDGTEWENVRSALARRNAVSFLVRPPPGPSGPFYRAVVFDRVN